MHSGWRIFLGECKILAEHTQGVAKVRHSGHSGLYFYHFIVSNQSPCFSLFSLFYLSVSEFNVPRVFFERLFKSAFELKHLVYEFDFPYKEYYCAMYPAFYKNQE